MAVEAREKRAEAKPVEASGLASVIAMLSGVKADEIARGIGAVKAGLFLLLIEALVWLSVPATVLLKDAANDHFREPTKMVTMPSEAAATPMQTLATAAARPAKPGTKAYYAERLKREFPQLHKKVAGGEMSVYAASIAAGLRKPAAKASKWTKMDAYLENANA